MSIWMIILVIYSVCAIITAGYGHRKLHYKIWESTIMGITFPFTWVILAIILWEENEDKKD